MSQLANQIANQINGAIDFKCAYQTVSLFGHMMADVAQLKVLNQSYHNPHPGRSTNTQRTLSEIMDITGTENA